MQWIDINENQPSDYQDVLWFCEGGRILTGMYYGEDHCKILPKSHGRSRKYYGKFGRYAEPAANMYKVLFWMPLPEPPTQEQE